MLKLLLDRNVILIDTSNKKNKFWDLNCTIDKQQDPRWPLVRKSHKRHTTTQHYVSIKGGMTSRVSLCRGLVISRCCNLEVRYGPDDLSRDLLKVHWIYQIKLLNVEPSQFVIEAVQAHSPGALFRVEIQKWLPVTAMSSCSAYLPKVPTDLHWHLPCTQKWPHMHLSPLQHCAYLILASGRQKSPHFAHHCRLKHKSISHENFMLLTKSKLNLRCVFIFIEHVIFLPSNQNLLVYNHNAVLGLMQFSSSHLFIIAEHLVRTCLEGEPG